MARNPAVDAYVVSQPAERQAALQLIRDTILAAAPDAEETMAYGMPAYKLQGPVIYFAAANKHNGIYPTPAAVTAFAGELSGYECSKGTIRLPLDEAIPVDLITRIVQFKVKENQEKKKK